MRKRMKHQELEWEKQVYIAYIPEEECCLLMQFLLTISVTLTQNAC